MKTTFNLPINSKVIIVKHLEPWDGVNSLADYVGYEIGTVHLVHEVDGVGESAIIGDQSLIVEAEEIEPCID